MQFFSILAGIKNYRLSPPTFSEPFLSSAIVSETI